jgi:hypoxanthine phosphoribosyltransferase
MEKDLRMIRSEDEIKDRIRTLADEISSEIGTGDLTVVGILDDTFMFLADLIRRFERPVSCCFMKVSRHVHGGQTEVMFTSEFDPMGRDILLVDGVAATGVTLDYVTRQLGERGVKSLRTCTLIDKPEARRVDVRPDYCAFQAGDEFVFGYGLGIQNQYRQLPYLAVFDRQA